MVIAKNNNSSSEFGQRLSELLKSSNISQRKLAHKSWNYRSSYFTIYQF